MRRRCWKDRRRKLYNEVSDPVNRKQNKDLELTTEFNTVEEVGPSPVFWPGEFHGLCNPWDHKELDMTERLSL